MRVASTIALCLMLVGSLASACTPFEDEGEARPRTITSTPLPTSPISTRLPDPTQSPTASPAQASIEPAATAEPTVPSVESRAERILGLVPVKPANVDLFMTEYLEQPVYPEAYPEASPMQPATGVERTVAEMRAELERFLVDGFGTGDARVDETLALFEDARIVERVPDARLRAAFVLLHVTIAAPLIDDFLDSGIYAGTLDWRDTGWAFTETSETGPDGKRYISMSRRYQHEHFALVAPNIVHALLHHDERFSYPEDLIILTLASATYLQFVALHPEIAHHGTELSRFNNTFAMALLNSHRSGSAEIRLIVPGGASVLPGSPEDAPDFWSLIVKEDGSSPMSPAGRAVFENLLIPGTPIPPDLMFGRQAVELIGGNVSAGVLGLEERLRASVLLTMISTEEIAVLLDMTPEAVIELFALQDIEALLAASN